MVEYKVRYKISRWQDKWYYSPTKYSLKDIRKWLKNYDGSRYLYKSQLLERKDSLKKWKRSSKNL